MATMNCSVSKLDRIFFVFLLNKVLQSQSFGQAMRLMQRVEACVEHGLLAA